jgi:hypothetical protein
VQFFHPGGNGIDSWNWNLDERQQSTAQNPQGIYAVFNEKNISLTVSNGFCSHTVSNQVLLDNYIKADFTVFQDNCPNEAIPFNGTPAGQYSYPSLGFWRWQQRHPANDTLYLWRTGTGANLQRTLYRYRQTRLPKHSGEAGYHLYQLLPGRANRLYAEWRWPERFPGADECRKSG